eukprot:1295459-Alexandrium_andersonii.AAC.1
MGSWCTAMANSSPSARARPPCVTAGAPCDRARSADPGSERDLHELTAVPIKAVELELQDEGADP